MAVEATKAGNGRLDEYELVLVITPEVELEALDATIESLVTKFVTASGGTVTNIERWGKKKLAYPIKHFVEGTYVLTRLNLKPASSKELEANLRISEQVLRHLLIKSSG
jgi:small subunit ribosomal protein S6